MTALPLAARDLRFAYPGGGDVLSGVSLDLAPGAFTAILGPNGCGKTTLLRLLSGALRPDAGEVLLGDRDLHEWPLRERARAMAVVPQSFDVTFPYTVAELVRMGRTPHLGRMPFEGPADIAAADAAVEALDLSHLRDRPLPRCSGGEQKRAVIARALAQQAGILLLDEPTASLDLHQKMAVYRLLDGLAARGATVAVVSHDLNLAARFCREAVLLDGGRIHARGAIEDVLTRAHLSPVYKVDLHVGRSERTGKIFVVPNC